MPKNFSTSFANATIRTEEIIRNDYRIACFCANPINRVADKPNELEDNLQFGFGRSRMWSQYGQDHRGVCIAFSSKALEQELGRLAKEKEQFEAGRVEYVEKISVPYAATHLNANSFSSDDLDAYCKRHIAIQRRSIFFIKHKDYIDEQEYRLVIHDNSNEVIYLDISKAIICILVGDRFHEVYVPSVIKLSSKLKISCARVYWSQGVPFVMDELKTKKKQIRAKKRNL